MSLVNISIVGNLVKQPEQHNFSSGKVKTTLVVAVDAPNRKRESDGRPDSDFYRVEAWGKLAEIAHKYLTKGSLVGATGRLVMNHWLDREGRTRVTPTVEADQIALPPKPKAGESSSGEVRTNTVVGEMQFDDVDTDNAGATSPAAAAAWESQAPSSDSSESQSAPPMTLASAVPTEPIPGGAPPELMPSSEDAAFDILDGSFVAEPVGEYTASAADEGEDAVVCEQEEDGEDTSDSLFAAMSREYQGLTITLTDDNVWVPEPLVPRIRRRG